MIATLARFARKGSQLRRTGSAARLPDHVKGDASAVLLHIPTSDGSGQACHPSVAHIADGLAGYSYWMANTPYAGKCHKLENPEIFASNDGVFWEVPQGARNPLVPPPPGDARHYHSDPCLLICEQTLWLFFRTSDEEANPRRDWLSLIRSTDGRHWSKPEIVLEDRQGRLLLSPSVRHVDGRFMMWTVEAGEGPSLAIVRRCSVDGLQWSSPERSTVTWADRPLEPWHLEVATSGDGFAMIMSARERGRSGTQRWCYATGDGLHWLAHELNRTTPWFETGKPYKPSFLPRSVERPSGWVYTSSASADGLWHTALRSGSFMS